MADVGASADDDNAGTSLFIGEIHTGILQNSSALTPTVAADRMALVAGEPLRVFSRPIHYVQSPNILTGLDCHITGASGVHTRVIGTAITRAAITGGHIVQSSTFARLQIGKDGRRTRWPRYLVQPGVLETSRRTRLSDLGLGFVTSTTADGVDLGALSSRVLDSIQRSGMDRRPPVRLARTQIRWMALVGRPSQIHFSIEHANLRIIRLRVPNDDLATIAAFCEDIAMHDWLLSCVVHLLDRTKFASGSPQQITQSLRPAFDHILHLWMPEARPHAALVPLWKSLDRGAGFSRQWEATAGRIRDQLAASTARLLDSDGLGPSL